MCGQSVARARLSSRRRHSLPTVLPDRADATHALCVRSRLSPPVAPARPRYIRLSLQALWVVRPEFVSQTCTLLAGPDHPMACGQESNSPELAEPQPAPATQV